MSDNILIDVSTTIENVNVEVVEASAASIGIEYFYPQGSIGPTGPQGPAGSSLWGTISGTISAQSDLWRYLSADSDAQTLSYIPSSYFLSISNGNTVNLSSINSTFASNSGKYEIVYSNVQSNSANWNTAYNTATAYQSISSSFVTGTFLNSNFVHLSGDTMTGGLTATNFKASIFYGKNGVTDGAYSGGTGGYIILNGGNGNSGDEWPGSNAGYINTSGGAGVGVYASPGGYINTSAGTGEGTPGGSIDTSNNGGSINTSGTENSSGGSINTSRGGSINTNTGSNGIGGVGGTGGSINLAGGDAGNIGSGGFNGGNAGSINLGGQSGSSDDPAGGRGGSILSTGGWEGGSGGTLNMSAGTYFASGGNITTRGGEPNSHGGSINTSGSTSTEGLPGGSINTSNGGGSIDTYTGTIELGHLNARTTLSKSSTQQRSIDFPDADGTVALSDQSLYTTDTPMFYGLDIVGPAIFNDNLTVQGNLTATGTTTFANTVFSVTSALSVVHIGAGPALWVGNNGLGDIASFYDIDQNIEILHVGGNNGTFPNVGVKTSAPNKDFTVKGEISASNTIYDGVGNSTQWNQAYNVATTYQSASGSFATNTTLNSVSSELKAFRGGITVTIGRANCDFNCSGTLGSPTDHITIQTAINSISATGGEVFIAEGTYYLGNTINIRVPNISVAGTGRATQLLAVGNYGNVFNCALSSVPSQWPGMAGLQFNQLRFETTVARTTGAAIRADYTHNAIFRDLYISDTTYGVSFGLVSPVPPAFYDGIYLDGQDQCHISKVTAQCSNYSVHVNGSGYANADFSYDGYIENCNFFGVPGPTKVGTGIHLGSNCGGLVIDFVSMNQLDYGVYADTSDPVPTVQGGGILTIRGGYVENATGHGYYIKGYQNTVVEQLWGELRVDGGNTTVLGVPNGSIIIDSGNALVYGTPNSITGAGTWTVIDTVGGGGGGSTTNNNKYIYLTSSVTLTSNYKFSLDTTASTLTAALPSTPEQGDEIELFDIAGTWNTNNLVVDSNTKLIEGYNDTLLCNVQYGLIKLIYTGSSTGWRIVPLPKHNVSLLVLAPIPVISAASFTGVTPFTITLSGINTLPVGTSPVTNWYWNLTGGNTAQFTTQNVTYTYTTSGSYTVNLTASNTAGFGTTTQTITAAAPSLSVDPYSDYVTLLLHFNP